MCLAFKQAMSYFPQRKVAVRALGSQIGLSGHLPRHPTNSLFYVMLGKSSNVSIYFMLPLISTCLLPCHYTALPMMLLCILLHTINHVRGLTRITKTAEMSIETSPRTLVTGRHIHVKDLKASKVTLLKYWKHVCVCGGGGALKAFTLNLWKRMILNQRGREKEREWNRSVLYAERKGCRIRRLK